MANPSFRNLNYQSVKLLAQIFLNRGIKNSWGHELSSPIPKPKPPEPSPNPVEPSQISSKGTGADTKILGHPTPPTTFKGCEKVYVVQVKVDYVGKNTG